MQRGGIGEKKNKRKSGYFEVSKQRHRDRDISFSIGSNTQWQDELLEENIEHGLPRDHIGRIELVTPSKREEHCK